VMVRLVTSKTVSMSLSGPTPTRTAMGS
jgi:hypothetical protein